MRKLYYKIISNNLEGNGSQIIRKHPTRPFPSCKMYSNAILMFLKLVSNLFVFSLLTNELQAFN